MVDNWKHPQKKVRVALVGKYVSLHDAYISVVESLKHAGVAHRADVEIKWVDSELVTKENVAEILGDVSGIIVPGGFGDRGIEGMICLSAMPVNTRFLTLDFALVCSLLS